MGVRWTIDGACYWILLPFEVQYGVVNIEDIGWIFWSVDEGA